jgi:cellulose biosynthesis protein BcsQ
MSNKELQDNQDVLIEMINQLHHLYDENDHMHIKRCIQQTMVIINQLVSISIKNLIKIKNAESQDQVICTQARFMNELNKEFSILNQHILNELLGQTIDHDAWLAAHCDLATD